jgi:ABC-2 type transport system ATP-binding protein
MPIIEAEQLRKVYPVAIKDPGWQGELRHFFRRRYRDIVAVNTVSFAIEPGEVVGFLGPNGAGKTTTLKMLTGLIYPSSGRCRVADCIPFRREPRFLRQISLVMGQKQQLIWDLPALDSLKINAAIYGLSDAEANRRVGDLAEMLRLEDQLQQPVRKLSLGERMKAELLAALLHNPKVMFLDEPTLGLDVNAQLAVRDFLHSYNERYGATILLTSHYMADISSLCPRVIVIHRGSLIYDGSLEGLSERFAPYREIHLDLAEPADCQWLEQFGTLDRCEGLSINLLVRQEKLIETVSILLAKLPVLDLNVEEPPLEEIIGRVFEQGSVD